MSCQDGQDGGGRGEIGGDAFTLALANGKLGNWRGWKGANEIEGEGEREGALGCG